MAYQHPDLCFALAWKHNFAQGIVVSGGSLSEWPAALGVVPTDVEQAQAVADYAAYRASAQAKDDTLQQFLDSAGGKVAKTLAGVLIDKGICTMAELKAKYRSL